MDELADRPDQLEPLDPRQVARISAVHGGFLYQHLYVVACLLTVGRQPGAQVIVEFDEDCEVLIGDRRIYSQVKTRNRPLQPADIADALARFALIRQEHVAGARDLSPLFQVVTNASLGPALEAAQAGENWPADVQLITPGLNPAEMPPAGTDIDALFAWCVARAQNVPFGSLGSETLVWKLAALVQHAATGTRDRSFQASDMPQLLEQLVAQLQDFPDPPERYRPQIDEPPLVSDQPFRLVTGFSGAGKTAWASQAALHSPAALVYFDVTDMASASMAGNLAREIAARFLGGRNAGVSAALFAQSSGLDVLRAGARRLAEAQVQVQVVLDNVHRIDAEALQTLVGAAPGVRFLCIGQPWPGAARLEAAFGVEALRLQGWSEDDIAAEFAAHGAPATLRQTQTLRRLTGGLPLYVRSAAGLAARAYGGDAGALCDAIETRTNDTATAQEIILDAAFADLDTGVRRTAAVLGLAETPLRRDEAIKLLGLAGVDAVAAASAIRQLRRDSIVVSFQGDRLGLHDAARVPAHDHGALTEDERQSLLTALSGLLMAALHGERDVVRLGFLLRLLARTGRVDVLVDLAGDEMFYEQGDPGALRREIEAAADDPAKSPMDRFWAQDSLAYWESRDGGQPDRTRLDVMRSLVAEGDLGPRERMALVFKELAYWGTERQAGEIEKAYRMGAALKVDTDIVRLLRYNYAIALNRSGRPGKAKSVLERLIDEYFAVVGTTERAVMGKNGEAFIGLLRKPIDYESCKRLGDCLNFWSTLVVKLGMYPGLRRIAAVKFYGAGQAARSAVSTAQELADDFLDGMGDAKGAIDVIEQHVLPMMHEAQLTDLVVLARSQYAIALAYGGRVREARQEMAALREYAGDAEQVAMLQERTQVVEEIAQGFRRVFPKPPTKVAGPRMVIGQPRVTAKVGRNDPCPCGSGEKFKRCCG